MTEAHSERGWPYSFEGKDVATPTITCDSRAAWYIIRLLHHTQLSRNPRKLRELEDELMDMESRTVMVGNHMFGNQGTVINLDDGSMLLLARPLEEPDDYELFRFTGEVKKGQMVHVDFGWAPPVASRENPLPGNLAPPRTSLETRSGKADR